MLYITTRNTDDAYTSYRALMNDCGPDGGAFVPFRIPVLTNSRFTQMKEKTFNENVADILNLFFSTQLTGWDLDFGIGRNLLRISTVHRRVAVAELWHNLEDNYDYIECILFRKITKDEGTNVTKWPRIAIRIAVMFGIYGQLLREEELHVGEHFDISVCNDDFVSPMAALYCRKMGMPVNTVICACDEAKNLWDFIHRGFINTANINEDMQFGIERLLHLTLGYKTAVEFSANCEQKRTFTIEQKDLPQLNEALFCSVSGKARAQTVINSLYRTNTYIIDDDAARSYGGLQDYRAKVGDSQLTVIFAEKTPLNCLNEIMTATGLNEAVIMKHIN